MSGQPSPDSGKTISSCLGYSIGCWTLFFSILAACSGCGSFLTYLHLEWDRLRVRGFSLPWGRSTK